MIYLIYQKMNNKKKKLLLKIDKIHNDFIVMEPCHHNQISNNHEIYNL